MMVESVKAIPSGIVVVWMKLLYFVIKFFGLSKLETCKNGNFVTEHRIRTNNMYLIPFFTAPGKKIQSYLLRQEDLKASVQVCKSWGCPMPSGNLSETLRWFGVFNGLDISHFLWKAKRHHSIFFFPVVWISLPCFSMWVFPTDNVNVEQISLKSSSGKSVILLLQ